MDVTQKHSRRTALKTGFAAAAATALTVPEAKAQESEVPSTWTKEAGRTQNFSNMWGRSRNKKGSQFDNAKFTKFNFLVGK